MTHNELPLLLTGVGDSAYHTAVIHQNERGCYEKNGKYETTKKTDVIYQDSEAALDAAAHASSGGDLCSDIFLHTHDRNHYGI